MLRNLGSILTLIMMMFLPLCAISCARVVDVLVSENACKLGGESIIVKCPKPLAILRDSNSISLFLDEEDWLMSDITNGTIKLKNGNVVSITITGYNEKGDEIIPGSYGMAGNYFCAYFAFRNTEKIIKIKIVASKDIVCKKIIWHCYNPI